MKNTVVKKVFIAIMIIIILLVAIFFIVKFVKANSKNYEVVEISEKDYQYFLIYSDEKFGVADINGNMIIENKYKDIVIPNPTKAVFFCTNEDGSVTVLNSNNEKIFSDIGTVSAIETDGITTKIPFDKVVLKYEVDGKYGLINFDGKVITKPIYEEISSVKYKEGEILAKLDGKYGVINNKGVELIPFEYDEIEADKYYNNNYKKTGYIVRNSTEDGYRYGYINSKWEKLLETEYTSLTRILEIQDEDVYLIASKNGQYGIIKNKEEQTDFTYQAITYNKDTNLLAVQRNLNYGVIDLKRKCYSACTI